MKWLYRHLYRKEKGFTLVELMIVIIILAILTGIAVPSYMVLRNRAREVAAKAELTNIATALEMYMADLGSYPATTFAVMAPLLEAGGYMNTVPTTDAWGALYTYVLAAGSYILTCTNGGGTALTITDGQPSW
jgi:type II secretion system protein G